MTALTQRRRRWSDNQNRWGIFTYAISDCYKNFAAVLDSGHGESPGCHLRLSAFGHTLITELPAIIKPWRRWVPTGHYSWAKSPDAGYWDEHSNEYGFSLSSEGFLQVFLGPQTMDSDTTKNWCAHLPWTQWRHIRRSLFDSSGKHFWTEWDRPRGFALRDDWMAYWAVVGACPTVAFEVEDHDGKRVRATTRIEEREWKFGAGWFKWLSLFRKPKIHRSLDIDFASEVGTDKGSWKGGLCGTPIGLLDGELHEAAFRRFCDLDQRGKYSSFKLKFIGPA